jgi:inhibitor of the pro-sigma K processing machinery
MSDMLVAVLLIVVIIAIIYYLVKNLTVLIINAILGIIALVLLNYFHVMEWLGKPDLGYSLATIIICALGGLPGVCILVLLDILGITV